LLTFKSLIERDELDVRHCCTKR